MDLKYPSNCYWGWRGIISVRAETLPYVHHMIGNGNSTFFCLDPWLDCGHLIDKFGGRTVELSTIWVKVRISQSAPLLLIGLGFYLLPFPCFYQTSPSSFLKSPCLPLASVMRLSGKAQTTKVMFSGPKATTLVLQCPGPTLFGLREGLISTLFSLRWR